MARIIIALLFAFAVAAPSAPLGADRGGIRPPAVAAQPNRLSEFADCENADDNFLSHSLTIILATPALNRLVQQAIVHNLHQTQHADRDSVPLNELHAVWRI